MFLILCWKVTALEPQPTRKTENESITGYTFVCLYKLFDLLYDMVEHFQGFTFVSHCTLQWQIQTLS